MWINSIPIQTRSLEAKLICVVPSFHFQNPLFWFWEHERTTKFQISCKNRFFINGFSILSDLSKWVLLVNCDESLTDL